MVHWVPPRVFPEHNQIFLPYWLLIKHSRFNRVIVQRLSYTRPRWVWLLASHMFLHALPGMITEYRAKNLSWTLPRWSLQNNELIIFYFGFSLNQCYTPLCIFFSLKKKSFKVIQKLFKFTLPVSLQELNTIYKCFLQGMFQKCTHKSSHILSVHFKLYSLYGYFFTLHISIYLKYFIV